MKPRFPRPCSPKPVCTSQPKSTISPPTSHAVASVVAALGLRCSIPLADTLLTGGGATALASLGSAVAEAASGTSEGVLAQWIADRLKDRDDRPLLNNHDLTRASGVAVAAVVQSVADRDDWADRKTALTGFARDVPDAWTALHDKTVSEADVTAVFTHAADAPPPSILTAGEWGDVLRRLADHLYPGGRAFKVKRQIISPELLQTLGEELESRFAKAVREVLKADAKGGGPAYAGLVLSLLGEILAVVKAGVPPNADASREEVLARGQALADSLRSDLAAISEELLERHAETLRRLDAHVNDLREAVEAEGQATRDHTTREAEKTRHKMDELSNQIRSQAETPSSPSIRPVQNAPGSEAEHFTGRDDLIPSIVESVQNHLVTALRGPGGIGKSAVASAVYAEVTGKDWADGGVQFLDLAARTTAAGLLEQISLDLDVPPPVKSGDDLARGLARRPDALIILDDVEQALLNDLDATAQVLQSLGKQTRGPHFLVTCRRSLGVGRSIEVKKLGEDHSRTLFRRTATSAGHTFSSDDEDALERLLDELDGHPLSIRLAALNVPVYGGVERLWNRWKEGPTRLLHRTPDPGEDARLTSLDVSVGLSYDGLDEHPLCDVARRLFARLADLPAGMDPDLAYKLEGDDGRRAANLLYKRGLADRDQGRYRLLVPLRHYATDTALYDDPDARHALDAALIDRARALLEEEFWFDVSADRKARLRTDLPNFEAVLDRAEEREASWQQHVTELLSKFYRFNLHLDAARTCFALRRRASALTNNAEGEARAFFDLGTLALYNGDLREAESLLFAARDAYRDAENRLGEANVLLHLGILARRTDDLGEAESLLFAARDAYRDVGSRLGEAHALKELGTLALRNGDLGEAESLLFAARDASRDAGDRLGEAHALRKLGTLARLTGDLREAESLLFAARDAYRDVGSRLGEANALTELGTLARRNGDLGEAESLLFDARDAYRDAENRLGEASALLHLGIVAALEENKDRARTLLTEARDLYTRVYPPRRRNGRRDHGSLRSLRGVGARTSYDPLFPHRSGRPLRLTVPLRL